MSNASIVVVPRGPLASSRLAEDVAREWERWEAYAMSAITDRHRAARVPLPSNDPVVRDVMAGIRARRGTRPRAKAPLSPMDLRAMLEVAHVSFHREGILVHVARSKTDQLGEGADVPVHAAGGALCPVREWLDATKIVGGPIFRRVDRWGRVGTNALTGRAVALIVKKAAERAGIDANELAGHSLRAGFATTAARAGANLAEIGRGTRHASEGMIRRYIRQRTAFERDLLRGVLCVG